MIKYILVLMMSFCLFAPAMAQELYDDTVNIELNSFAEDQALDIELPSCEDAKILEKVIAKIKDYQAQKPVNNIIEKRQRILILKKLQNFSQVEISPYKNGAYFYVADEVLKTKINKQVAEKDMRLCIDNNESLFLLIYPENGDYRVEILNFVSPTKDGNNFYVFYNQ